MPNPSRSLRATSDALLRDLDALVALEAEKRLLPLGDPRTTELARQIEEIAGRLLGRTQSQTTLAEAAAETAPHASIDTIRRSPSEILEEWRALERRAATLDPDSAEAAETAVLLDRIRDEYHRAARASQSG